jgi:hypothetical protein
VIGFYNGNVAPRIVRAVVSIKEAAWLAPDEDGTDIAGCANVLAEDRPAPSSERSGLTR